MTRATTQITTDAKITPGEISLEKHYKNKLG